MLRMIREHGLPSAGEVAFRACATSIQHFGNDQEARTLHVQMILDQYLAAE